MYSSSSQDAKFALTGTTFKIAHERVPCSEDWAVITFPITALIITVLIRWTCVLIRQILTCTVWLISRATLRNRLCNVSGITNLYTADWIVPLLFIILCVCVRAPIQLVQRLSHVWYVSLKQQLGIYYVLHWNRLTAGVTLPIKHIFFLPFGSISFLLGVLWAIYIR